MVSERTTKVKTEMENFIEQNKNTRFNITDIANYLKEKGITPNKTTLYRNLEKLTSGGKLIKYKNANDDMAYYQYVGSQKGCFGHLHLQCTGCGKIFHLDDEMIKGFYKHITLDYGFALSFTESVIYGKCCNCQI